MLSTGVSSTQETSLNARQVGPPGLTVPCASLVSPCDYLCVDQLESELRAKGLIEWIFGLSLSEHQKALNTFFSR